VTGENVRTIDNRFMPTCLTVVMGRIAIQTCLSNVNVDGYELLCLTMM